jgi:ankyrin repeat protein
MLASGAARRHGQSGRYDSGRLNMIRPVDLKDDDVWSMFQASWNGDLDQVKALVAHRPELAVCEYNYTPPIHFAVREGHLETVRYLLEHGADPTYRSYPFQESLLTIAQDRERHEVAQLLHDILARQFPVTDGVAGFLDAARRGDLTRIRKEMAVDPSLARASNDLGDTALHNAALGGHMAVMNELLDAGAFADAVRADGKRPIHFALDRRERTALRAGVLAGTLLARGAAYNIYLAAVLGDMEYVREALARDRTLANFEDSSHQRPLSAAARRNDMEMVELLLAHGANPSLPEEGAPLGGALWIAVYQKQREMAKLLLEHGADPNTAPESSGSAISHTRKDPELRNLLLKYGAREEFNERKELENLISDDALEEVEKLLQKRSDSGNDLSAFWGEGILAGPANSGRREMIELLIRYGARVPDVSKWAPYYYFKHAEIAALLLERGMNPNHMNWHHFTLLHHMAAQGEMEKARLLLDHGASIDALDEEYRSTPLGCAARRGQKEMVELLLARGADPNRAGAPWARPLVWARKNGHSEIEAMLRQAGAE